MMESSDNEENDASTSSREPLNTEMRTISQPPVSGGPPPYRNRPPDYQEALGLLSPAAVIVSDGEAPPEYIELTDVRPRIGSAEPGISGRSDEVDGSTVPVRRVNPARSDSSIRDETETTTQDYIYDMEPEETPATNTADVEDGSDGRRERFQEILERLKTRKRFLVIFPVVLTCVVIFMATFPVSFHYIHFYDIALKRSKWTGWVDFKTVYSGGCYVIGPEMEFIRFEATSQIIDNELSVTSSSSLAYKLRLAVIYQLRKSDLPMIYRKFAGQHREVLKRVIATTAKNRAVSIDVDSWMFERRKMEMSLENAVASVLSRSYHVDINQIYLLDITFPKQLLQRLMAQEELILKSQTAEYNLNEKVEQIKTKKLTMDIENSANEITEDAKARANYVYRVANADSKLVTTKTLADSLLNFRANTSLSSSEQLMSAYMFTNLRTMATKNHLLVTQKNTTSAFRKKNGGISFVDSLAMAAAATAFPLTP